MKILFVTEQLHDWPFGTSAVEVVTASHYLHDPVYRHLRCAQVFNFSSSFAYQSPGYYVSLLAEARGHQVCPDIKTIEDLHSDNLSRLVTCPLGEVPETALAAIDCTSSRKSGITWIKRKPALAILHDHSSTDSPSNPGALQKFREAADIAGIRTEMITAADTDRLVQFDALFIRDATRVNHYTYQIARQAAMAGLVVLDDCDSIVKCSNKVYLAELMSRTHIPIPKTLMVHKDNIDAIIPALGLPCILKQPDGAFSLGVHKAQTESELHQKIMPLLARSALVIAQQYLPTEFDWRVGILDRHPVFACKYFMVPGHWQVNQHDGDQRIREGRTEAVSIDDTPRQVIECALEAANQIGDGFYGVDLKQIGQQCYVIEINDNPNVDAGNEDGVRQEALYLDVMHVLRKRIAISKRRCRP